MNIYRRRGVLNAKFPAICDTDDAMQRQSVVTNIKHLSFICNFSLSLWRYVGLGGGVWRKLTVAYHFNNFVFIALGFSLFLFASSLHSSSDVSERHFLVFDFLAFVLFKFFPAFMLLLHFGVRLFQAAGPSNPKHSLALNKERYIRLCVSFTS